jgi:hypothetical protein
MLMRTLDSKEYGYLEMMVGLITHLYCFFKVLSTNSSYSVK